MAPTKHRRIGVPRRFRSCVRNAAPCALPRPVRDDELRQVRGHGPRRARLARPRLRVPDPEAGPARPRADAEPRRAASSATCRSRASPRTASSSSGRALPRNSTCAGSQQPNRRTTSSCVRPRRRSRVFRSRARTHARSCSARAARISSAPPFKFFHVKQTAVGFAPAIVTRAGFTGELGYEIWTTPDYFASLYTTTCVKAGSDRRARALRRPRAVVAATRKGVRLVQQGFPPGLHAGRNRARTFRRFHQGRLHRPRGRARPRRAAGPKRRFVVMEVDAEDADVVGYESIIKDGRAGGVCDFRRLSDIVSVTQPRRGLRPRRARSRRRALRDRHPRRVLSGHGVLWALHDPDGLRLRS